MTARKLAQGVLALHAAPVAAAVRMKAVQHLDGTMTQLERAVGACGRCGRLTERREVYVQTLEKRALACIPCNKDWI